MGGGNPCSGRSAELEKCPSYVFKFINNHERRYSTNTNDDDDDDDDDNG